MTKAPEILGLKAALLGTLLENALGVTFEVVFSGEFEVVLGDSLEVVLGDSSGERDLLLRVVLGDSSELGDLLLKVVFRDGGEVAFKVVLRAGLGVAMRDLLGVILVAALAVKFMVI